MELTATDQPNQPTRQLIEAQDRSLPGKVTGKLKRALDAMIWDGKKRDEAAQSAGLSIHGLREALKRPHVKSYYKAELEVLRENERARNIHALVEVRDQKSNQMARVQAVKALEQIADEPANSPNAQKLPGLVVQINVAHPAMVDVTNVHDLRTEKGE